LKKTFIDKLRVYVKSGNGGTGVKKMGGIGGNGTLTTTIQLIFFKILKFV
jgi:hypothetical protein